MKQAHAHPSGVDNNELSAGSDYDVVILGAGVAGLLLASELSRFARVLVLERNTRAVAVKYWVTTEDALTRNPDLAPAADLAFESMDFIAFDGRTYRCKGAYRLWNTAGVLDLLLERITTHGGTIAFGQSFYSYARLKDRVMVMANDRTVTARLAVDCMGHQSPILAAEGCGDTIGYYLLYGATFPMAGSLMPIALHNVSLNAHAAYIEAFPTKDNHLHIVLIVPERQLRHTDNLKAEFEFVVHQSPYRHFIADARERTFLGGIIPIFRMRRRSLHRLFLYGEAGQVHPAAAGTALTRMLLSYREVAAFLLDRLQQDRLSESDLAVAPGGLDRINQAIQLALFRDILRWSSRRFRNIVAEVDQLGDHTLMNQLFFGDLNTSAAGIAKTVAALVRAKNWTLLSAFANGLARSITT